MTAPTNNEHPNNEERVPVSDPVAGSTIHPKAINPKDSYEGRKHDPKIDGPEQASQETDEVYSDPRKEENLPAGGKKITDLNAHDLSQNNNI